LIRTSACTRDDSVHAYVRSLQTTRAAYSYVYARLRLYLKFAGNLTAELCHLNAKNSSNRLPPHQGKFERGADRTWLGEDFILLVSSETTIRVSSLEQGTVVRHKSNTLARMQSHSATRPERCDRHRLSIGGRPANPPTVSTMVCRFRFAARRVNSTSTMCQ
jgi:hypothetical protein